MLNKFHARSAALLGGVVSLAVMAPANADTPAKARRAGAQTASVRVAPNAEKGFEKALLGVRILQSYKVALAKLGQPSRIFRADEYIDIQYDTDAKGNYTGGVTDVVSGGDANKDAPGGGNAAGAPPASGDPNDPNTPTDPNAPGAPTPGGFGGGLNSATEEKPPETFGQSGGFRWVYLMKAEKKAYIFTFNHDGRLLWVMEAGLGFGSPTRRGINLGSSLSEVYQKYGWPDSVQENKESMQLFYDIKHHCQFDIVKNKVAGIVVVLSEGMKIRKVKDHNGNGNPGGGPSGGRPGGGGGPGSPQSPRSVDPG